MELHCDALAAGRAEEQIRLAIANKEYQKFARRKAHHSSGSGVQGRTTLLLEVTQFNLVEGFLAAKKVRTKLR